VNDRRRMNRSPRYRKAGGGGRCRLCKGVIQAGTPVSELREGGLAHPGCLTPERLTDLPSDRDGTRRRDRGER
jgi:hypothetical protein